MVNITTRFITKKPVVLGKETNGRGPLVSGMDKSDSTYQKKHVNTLALLAFLTALCSIWVSSAPVALMLGTIASNQIKETREKGAFFAEFAIIVGTVVTVLMVVLSIWEMITGIAW